MKIAKRLSFFMALVMVLSMTSLAAPDGWGWGQWTTQATFYLLNEGLIIPTGTASQPAQNYSYAGKGKITAAKDWYNGGESIESVIAKAPNIPLKEGQEILWYVVKKEDEGWHVDGVIVPFYSVLYDANADVSGATTDGRHYFRGDTIEIQPNGFVREGYTFTGWNTAADGSGAGYQPGDKLATDEFTFAENVNTLTVYAQWSKDEEQTPAEPEERVTIQLVTPQKRCVRFADGTILYNGDSFTMPKYGSVSFQMCTVNWDTGKYTDGGEGFCGTKVYTYTHQKGKDNVLRTDTNTYFMAVRFHFAADYNKQTGIANVIETPLESWSVNLPLGAVVKADAYVGYTYQGSADIFVETAEDKTICYTDYNWPY